LVEQGLRFDVSFDRLEDLDFFVACGTRTDFLFVPEVTCTWHAFTGSSGMGYADNFNRDAQERATTRIREKWAKAFERWSREPEGLLALAERASQLGHYNYASKLDSKIATTTWRSAELRVRYARLAAQLCAVQEQQ
jgi:hypothetical protein